MPEDEAIYEPSMIRDRLDEIDKILGQERPTVGIGGKLIDDASRMHLAACIEKALALADVIAAQHDALATAPVPQQPPTRG